MTLSQSSNAIVWTIWQWTGGSKRLVRIYASEQDANAYVAENSYPEHEAEAIPYAVIGGQ